MAGVAQCLGLSVVDAVRGHVGDARVPMLCVVPGEESLAVGACILKTAETPREVRAVFHRLELRFRVWVVVRNVRSAVAFGDVQVHQQDGHRLGAHAGAAVGVQRERAALDVVAGHAVGDELLDKLRTLALGDHPAHDMAAEDVQDHVEVKACPLGRPLELGDVPGPDPILFF